MYIYVLVEKRSSDSAMLAAQIVPGASVGEGQ